MSLSSESLTSTSDQTHRSAPPGTLEPRRRKGQAGWLPFKDLQPLKTSSQSQPFSQSPTFRQSHTCSQSRSFRREPCSRLPHAPPAALKDSKNSNNRKPSCFKKSKKCGQSREQRLTFPSAIRSGRLHVTVTVLFFSACHLEYVCKHAGKDAQFCLWEKKKAKKKMERKNSRLAEAL